jgi:glycosyltransferase involved in cell wall biosynthesis
MARVVVSYEPTRNRETANKGPGIRRVLVVNAGTHPEPAHLAAGLRALGIEITYATSATWPARSITMRFARSALGKRLPFVRQVARRALPAGLDNKSVTRLAGKAEAAFQVTRRVAPGRYQSALNRRTKNFRRAAARLARRREYEIVVAQQSSALEVFEATPSAVRILSYPIAHHRWMLRELASESDRNPLWRGSLQGNERSAEELAGLDREIDLADFVLVGSSFVKRTLVEEGIDESKIRILGLGANVDELGFIPGSDAKRSREVRGLQVIFAGQLTQRKGLSYLLEGFRLAAVAGSTLTLVGTPVGDALTRIPRQEDIHVLGSVPRSELGRILAAADVLVLPSLAEGFPLVAIEAMSCGTPCVLSSNTFAEDVITDWHDGVIVEPADPSAIATALRTLASDHALLEKMSLAARRRASGYTWERYSTKSAQLILRLAGLHASSIGIQGGRP